MKTRKLERTRHDSKAQTIPSNFPMTVPRLFRVGSSGYFGTKSLYHTKLFKMLWFVKREKSVKKIPILIFYSFWKIKFCFIFKNEVMWKKVWSMSWHKFDFHACHRAASHEDVSHSSWCLREKASMSREFLKSVLKQTNII